MCMGQFHMCLTAIEWNQSFLERCSSASTSTGLIFSNFPCLGKESSGLYCYKPILSCFNGTNHLSSKEGEKDGIWLGLHERVRPDAWVCCTLIQFLRAFVSYVYGYWNSTICYSFRFPSFHEAFRSLDVHETKPARPLHVLPDVSLKWHSNLLGLL
ncbi:hypothetical protein VNO77_23422 [Canavalia gladiata]|uniref:Uncharacterized protein n=1 Tax=Canavalia gladiata TaxID=3824 RepID=A0AAN9QBP2_CANGL